MHYGMQYDPIQGQGQGHELLKVGNSAILCHVTLKLALSRSRPSVLYGANI